MAFSCFGSFRQCKDNRGTQVQGLEIATNNVRLFSYNSLRSATENFHPSKKIGGGGFGVVYKGVLRDGMTVAIKCLSAESKQGTSELLTEINMISNTRHPNLVQLIGCCVEGVNRIIWDYCSRESEYSGVFNDAMASDSKLISNLLISDCCSGVFEGLTSLVDVGGGTGTVAMAIAGDFPSLKCTVLDLPHAIGDRKGTQNLEFVAGDMFDKIPHANAILLKWILHDWNDENCVKILKKCKESIPSKENGGKVIIIDIVMEENCSNNEQLVQSQHLMDLLVRIIYASKERSNKEWEKLFLDAGFSGYK